MVLLRRVIGDALRARRQSQRRTLREVSTKANVSLGYLSEIERGQKEASSELLASICEALGAQLSELLRDVSDTLALAEHLPRFPATDADAAERDLVKAADLDRPDEAPARTTPEREPEPVGAMAGPANEPRAAAEPVRQGARKAMRTADVVAPRRRTESAVDGDVTVMIRHDSPLKTTLRTSRVTRRDDATREPAYV